MNERFIEKFNNSGLTQYALSNISGVPYSTINGLLNGTHAVNKCAASTFLKLARVLNEEPEELLDPYPVMDKKKGKYLGYEYRMEYDGSYTNVILKDGNRKIKLETMAQLKHPEDADMYQKLVECKIERYIELKEFYRTAEEYLHV